MITAIEKFVGRDNERPSRFHSRRGVLLPPSELVRVPSLVARRARGPRPEPWMARGAVERLDQLLTNETSLLELGSGMSTLWYGQRTKQTISLEDDAEWASRVAVMIRDCPNVELRQTDISVAIEELADQVFDVAVVDHKETHRFTRPDAVSALKERAEVIVLDDSDRGRYANVDSMLRGWKIERYRSLLASPFRATETTIYYRPT